MSDDSTKSAASLAGRWTSRKFWAMMVWQSVVVWLRMRNYIPVEAFVSLTYLLLGGYFVGNVTQAILAPTTKEAPK